MGVLLTAIRDAFGPDIVRLRQIYLEPEVRDDYAVDQAAAMSRGAVRFLSDEHAFGRDRVMAALERAFGSDRLL
jgi:hypothetical protein